MGLKQDVANAMQNVPDAGASPSTAPEVPARPPVDISGEALRVMSAKVRQWSGWPDARLVFGTPTVSPHADTDSLTRTITANPETLILNPHRVLLTITPFRLRQEAVLTGALLHEAGHARHSRWLPRTEEEAKAKPLIHSDGSAPTKQEVALARLMEEPRIEGLQARDADAIGATGLDWTMKASAAHLIPTTVLDLSNPNQTLMDLIESWTLRAGRQIGLNYWSGESARPWVNDFTELVFQSIVAHLTALAPTDMVLAAASASASIAANEVMSYLREMIYCDDDTGSTMIDYARDVLTRLFPETPPEDMPTAGSGCGEEDGTPTQTESVAGEGSGEGTEEGTGADETGEQGEGGGQGQPEDEGAGEGSTEREPTTAEKALAEALAAMEAEADAAAKTEAKTETKKEPPKSKVSTAGNGGTADTSGGFRDPTKEEREIAKNAGGFLRDLISPSESNKVSLSDSPSATVDPAALAAWRADGGSRAPHFFKRTRREVEPAPPVKIAVLVDVSSSMGVLQKPSALLSWALASAAIDHRNFAGRGQQIESTLIHWGRSARVIQKNGAMLPGIREVACNEGTTAMGDALALVEEQIPGFFDASEKPVHRLLVQFTDWELWGNDADTVSYLSRALGAGVNMLTVAPGGFWGGQVVLNKILRQIPVQRGTNTLIKYNKMFPEAIWESAVEALT